MLTRRCIYRLRPPAVRWYAATLRTKLWVLVRPRRGLPPTLQLQVVAAQGKCLYFQLCIFLYTAALGREKGLVYLVPWQMTI